MQTALMTSSPKSPAAFASLGPNARISVDDQFSKKSGGVCQSGSKCKNTENNSKGCQRSRHLHSEIGIPEDHDTKKNNNAYDTVFISEDFAVAHNKSHTENHGDEDLEQINGNMAQLFPGGGRSFDDCFRTLLVQLQLLIKCHRNAPFG